MLFGCIRFFGMSGDDMLASMSSARLKIGRVVEPGAWYVVTTVTRGRAAILQSDAAACVAEEIGRCEDSGCVLNISWVVMPDHLHWLFELQGGDLTGLMRVFKSQSARRIRAFVPGIGPVWQAGFYDHRVRPGEDLQSQAHYIQQNPYRSGLVAAGVRYPYAWCRYPD